MAPKGTHWNLLKSIKIKCNPIKPDIRTRFNQKKRKKAKKVVVEWRFSKEKEKANPKRSAGVTHRPLLLQRTTSGQQFRSDFLILFLFFFSIFFVLCVCVCSLSNNSIRNQGPIQWTVQPARWHGATVCLIESTNNEAAVVMENSSTPQHNKVPL